MKSTSWKVEFRGGQILREAQRLARSGHHADHTTIIPLLQHLDGFEAARARLEDRAVRFQLDSLCAMRRAGREQPMGA
jgi:hypothetical protein